MPPLLVGALLLVNRRAMVHIDDDGIEVRGNPFVSGRLAWPDVDEVGYRDMRFSGVLDVRGAGRRLRAPVPVAEDGGDALVSDLERRLG